MERQGVRPGVPGFLLIGAARCGTTTIYQWLLEHPELYVPPSKRPEPHFFLKAEHYQRGFGYYIDRWFADAPPGAVAGEASSSYLYHPVVPARIAAHLPGVKLLVTLRQPIDRAYSSYLFTRRNGLETLSFEEAIEREPERLAHPATTFDEEVRPHAYLDRSRYITQIERYLGHFDRAQMKVLLFDDLAADPGRVAGQVFGFLGVDAGFRPPSLGAALNSARDDTTRPIPPATRARLVEHFREANGRLARFLGRDLSHWDH